MSLLTNIYIFIIVTILLGLLKLLIPGIYNWWTVITPIVILISIASCIVALHLIYNAVKKLFNKG